jgi:hypothetical protein
MECWIQFHVRSEMLLRKPIKRLVATAEIKICYKMKRGWQKAELITIAGTNLSNCTISLGLVSRNWEIKRKLKMACDPGKVRNQKTQLNHLNVNARTERLSKHSVKLVDSRWQ